MKRWILAFVTVFGLAVLASTASAQGYGRYGYAGGYNCAPYAYGGYNYGPGVGLYNSGYRGLNLSYGGLNFSYGYQPQWHDTTHWDYHPGYLQRHGNHFHVVPGHYDLHRSGHWHP